MCIRDRWPIAVTAALMSRRARWALVAAVAVTAASDVRAHRGTLDPASAAALRLADDVAYGAGVWAGMWRVRTIDPIVPVLSSWPGRTGAAS